MADHILAFLGRVRRIDPDKGRPGGHRPQRRKEPLGLILADDGDMVPFGDAELSQSEGHIADILEIGRPGNVVPDAQVLVSHRNPFGLLAGDPDQGLGQCIDHHTFFLN